VFVAARLVHVTSLLPVQQPWNPLLKYLRIIQLLHVTPWKPSYLLSCSFSSTAHSVNAMSLRTFDIYLLLLWLPMETPIGGMPSTESQFFSCKVELLSVGLHSDGYVYSGVSRPGYPLTQTANKNCSQPSHGRISITTEAGNRKCNWD